MSSREKQARRRFAAAIVHRLFRPSRFALAVCLFLAVLALILSPLANFGLRSGWKIHTSAFLRDGPGGITERPWGRYEDRISRGQEWGIDLKLGVDRYPGRRAYTLETVTMYMTDFDEPVPSPPFRHGIPERVRAAAADAMARQHDLDPIFLDMIRTGQTTRTVRTPYWWLEIPARVLAPTIPALLCIIFLIRGVRRELVRRRLTRCRSGRCPACAYPTKHVPADRCPECGTHLADACTRAERIIRGPRPRGSRGPHRSAVSGRRSFVPVPRERHPACGRLTAERRALKSLLHAHPNDSYGGASPNLHAAPHSGQTVQPSSALGPSPCRE